ncbi:MAG: 16S rRNA (guanine(527)-N(7))-methyltransferase RsmG [Desulfotignum sp.]|nr:16S rRNA (guanine(527)-N(7))-methyltransferase RsmG [Desulfotignum sp.]
MDVFCKTLRHGSRDLGVFLTEKQVDQMACHAAELEKWNRHVNLTAIKGPKDIARKHFLDALAIQPYIHSMSGQFLDMGTGGGFPGLPLKLLNPKIRMVLMDASRKKIHFLKHVIRMLGIDGIEAIHGRVDELHNDGASAGRFHGILARGLADLERLAEMAAPLLAPSGVLYALKSPDAAKEITGGLEHSFFITWDDYELPDGNEKRSLARLSVK